MRPASNRILPTPSLDPEQRLFFRGAVWNLVGSFVFAFAAWLLTFLIAKHSGAGHYQDAGIFAVAASYGNIFRIISAYGLRPYQISETGDASVDQPYIASRVVTVLLGAVLCLAGSLLFGYDAEQIWAINIYMIFNNVCAFADVLYGVMQRHGRIDLSGVSMTLRGVITTIVFGICLFLTNDLLLSLWALTISAALILVFYDFPVTNRYYPVRLSRADFQSSGTYQLLKRGFPMLLFSVFITLITFAPRILLERMAGHAEVGIFTYVFTPTVVISTFATGVLMPYITKMTEYWDARDYKKLRNAFFAPFGMILLIGVCGVGFSYLLGRWMLTLLYDAIVGEHTNLLVIAVVASTLLSLSACCNNILIVVRRMKALTYLNAAGLLLTMAACYWLIPPYGMYGAGYAMVLGVTLELLVTAPLIASILRQAKIPKVQPNITPNN